MRPFPVFWLVAVILFLPWVYTLPTIIAKGTLIKVILTSFYPTDTLLNTKQCQLDASLMKTLSTNTIRVYHVQGGRDHSGCVQAFADAGIYIFLDLDTWSTQIDQMHPSWTTSQKNAFEAVMDEFAHYDNTAGFSIGNEVITMSNHSEAAVYVKAATRDMKAYRNSKGYCKIPVGYSHADISSLRPHLQNYLACGSNPDESIDFFGLNDYEWCGSSSYKESHYDKLTQQIKHYPIPAFLSETGCKIPEPRTFADQIAVFGPEMSPFWSGSVLYEWVEQVNHYGLVAYESDATVATAPTLSSYVLKGTPMPVNPDFGNLKSVWAKVSPRKTFESDYSPSDNPPTCPAYTKGRWEVAGNVALPTLNEVYNKAVQFSITAGHLQGKPHATGSATRGSSTSKAAAGRILAPLPLSGYVGGKEVFTAMFAMLAGVSVGFIWWL